MIADRTYSDSWRRQDGTSLSGKHESLPTTGEKRVIIYVNF